MTTNEFYKELDTSREADILKTIGHPVRLKIIAGLLAQDNGECNVSKIWECLEMPQATVSQHLALLRGKGIILGERRSTEVYYRVVSRFAINVVSVLLENHRPSYRSSTSADS